MANTKKYVSLDKLGLYDEKIKGLINAADAAALQAAKDYADSLAPNYDATGSAATAEANAKGYTDDKITEVNGVIAGVKAIAEQGVADAAAAKAAADVAQGEVDALEAYVGTFTASEGVDTVVKYIDKKTTGIATEAAMNALGDRVTQAETDIDNIEKDYLKAADKTELEGKITVVDGKVDSEKARAEGIEAGLRTDVDAIKADYLKAADKTELQNNIDTLTGVVETLTDGVDADKVDGVKDLIKYVEDHGPEVTGMKEDIAENAEAISGVAGRVDTLEGEMDAVEGAVATKAEKTYVDEQVQALQGVDSGFETRIAGLEAKFTGEGSVEDMIADAKAEAIAAAAKDATDKDTALEAKITEAYKKYADDEDAKIEARVADLETASATHALASDLTALAGRVTTVEGKVGTLETKMEAVEALAAANKAAHEANAAAIALKADTTALNAVSDRVTTLETWHNNFTEVSEEEINKLFEAKA